MAFHATPLVSAVDLGVAIRPLDTIRWVCHFGGGIVVLPSAERQAAILGDFTGSRSGGWLLDRIVIYAGHLFPKFCEFQQNIRHPRSCCSTDGMAVLDGIRDADRGRAERGISKEDQARSG